MAKIILRPSSDEPGVVHRLFNFGEDVWHEFRDNKRVHMNPDKIDQRENGIVLEVRDSFLNGALKTVERIYSDHYPDRGKGATISIKRKKPDDILE